MEGSFVDKKHPNASHDSERWINTNQSSTINTNNLSVIIVCMHVQAMLPERCDQKHKNLTISNVLDSHKPVFILIGGEIPPKNFSDFPSNAS